MSGIKKHDTKQFLIKTMGSSAAIKCCSFEQVHKFINLDTGKYSTPLGLLRTCSFFHGFNPWLYTFNPFLGCGLIRTCVPWVPPMAIQFKHFQCFFLKSEGLQCD